MPIPEGITQITVTGQNICDSSGTPYYGTVSFTPANFESSSSIPVVMGVSTVHQTVTSGVMEEVELPTNDSVLVPSNSTYVVRQEYRYSAEGPVVSVRQFSVQLLSTMGASVDLGALSPAVTPPPVVTYLVAADNLSDVPSPSTARTNLGVVEASVDVPGLVTPPGGTTEFLRADGTWTAPSGGVALDPNAAHITPIGVQGAGSRGLAADSGHTHPYHPWEFYVGSYGAVGDNATDDTAHINAAIAAGFSYAQSHNGYFELVLDPLTYLVSGNPTTGGATNGSAQLPIPIQPQTSQKIIMVIRGTRDQTALYHWLQTTPQRAGAVIRSTYNGGNTLPATGEVSVIGGPTPHFMGDPPSSWNNVLIVIDGVSIEIPPTINICGFDFRCMAEASIPNAGVLALSTGTGAPQIPQPQWSFGLAMPVANNNDLCDIGRYSCEGLVVGLQVYEHATGDSIRLINCFDGLVSFSSSGFPHRSHFKYVSIENCTQTIVLNGGFNKMDIECADIEWGSGAIVKDASATPALGRIGITSNGDSGASLNAALNSGATAVTAVNGPLALEIINLDQPLGPVTPPAVPGSTTPLTNPFWRRAEVQVHGGTVTVVAIDGVNQLNTSGSFTVPPGHTITLTYSVAPTWAWNLVA